MLTLQGKIPRSITVACSGGVDSMAVVDFLKRNHTVTLLFVDHCTEASELAKAFLRIYAWSHANITLKVVNISNSEVPKGTSQEEHWRNERYAIFHDHHEAVVTCHHLADCAETWVWSSMHGKGKIIPYRNHNVIRPFRLVRKQQFIDWCKKHTVAWSEDSSNADTKYMRNFIRHEVMEKMLVINPGLHTVIKKKVEQDFELFVS